MAPKPLYAILAVLFFGATFQLQAQDLENWVDKNSTITYSPGSAHPGKDLIHQQLSQEVNQAVVAPAKSLVAPDSFGKNAGTLAIGAGALFLAYLLFALLNQMGAAKATPVASTRTGKEQMARQAA